MEISRYWGYEIFVPRSVNINTVSGMADSVPIFFFLTNAGISLKPSFISHRLNLNILCMNFD